MKTLKKIVVKTELLVLYFGLKTVEVIAGAVDVVTDGKTDLERKYRKALISALEIHKEES